MTFRFSYLGPRGTFTEAAAQALRAREPWTRGAAGPDALPCASIQATLEAVRSGEAEQGVVPIEKPRWRARSRRRWTSLPSAPSW